MQMCKDVARTALDAKQAEIYPRYNMTNLVVTSPTSDLAGGFSVKLSGMEHAKCWSKKGAPFLRNIDADDIQQGKCKKTLSH